MTKFRASIEEILRLVNGAYLKNIQKFKNKIIIELDKMIISSQTQIRVIKSNKILFTKMDSFCIGDEGLSSFDVNLETYRPCIMNKRVLKSRTNEYGDIFLILDDNVKIEILVDSGNENFFVRDEIYRFIINDLDEEIIIKTNKRIEKIGEKNER